MITVNNTYKVPERLHFGLPILFITLKRPDNKNAIINKYPLVYFECETESHSTLSFLLSSCRELIDSFKDYCIRVMSNSHS